MRYRNLDRRQFCAGATAAMATAWHPANAQSNTSDAFAHTHAWIAETDRKRILAAAEQYIARPIQTLTSFTSPRSPGGPHDFFSEADYFWPNPKDPTGPYKERDGQSNPTNFNDHRKAMMRLSIEMPALTAAWLLLRRDHNKRDLAAHYAKHAGDHLRAWFVSADSRMTPNLEFAQGVRNGGPTGRSYGIIDTLHLVEVARAASLLMPATFARAEQQAVQAWFRDYLHWLQTSEKGMKERDSANNHAVCWALQAAEFARLAGDDATRDEIRTRYRTVLVPMQMGKDGGFPRELARTKPYSYSIFNFDVMAALCQSLEDSKAADDLFRFTLNDGRGICKAASFLFPYLEDKSRWPYAHDVEHYDALPVRSPGLLFCGIHCRQPRYLTLWRRLNPDPTDAEIIRNFPIRQPVLWFAQKQEAAGQSPKSGR